MDWKYPQWTGSIGTMLTTYVLNNKLRSNFKHKLHKTYKFRNALCEVNIHKIVF